VKAVDFTELWFILRNGNKICIYFMNRMYMRKLSTGTIYGNLVGEDFLHNVEHASRLREHERAVALGTEAR